jgi:hypothetical protein
MARILSLDDCPVSLRNHLVRSLRSLDEAVLLPQAERRDDTGTFKNIVFRLAGNEADVPISIFNPSWFSGVSAVKVSGSFVNKILNDPAARAAALARLKDAIPSETADSSLHVGPALDCDETDHDKTEWTAGFDSPSCFVGLFSADHSTAPDPTKRGMNRTHQTTYLVCKAGSGIAGATFHARLIAALKKGGTLENCLDRGEPGPAALRRVTMAGSRNRARILMMAADALGAPTMDSVPDTSSRGKYRCCVTSLDVNVNCIRKVEDAVSRPTFQYTTAVDAATSQGLVSLSNAADGVVLLLSSSGEVRQTLRNEAHSTLPCSSTRITSDTDLIASIVKEYKDAAKHNEEAHFDSEFLRSRFTWKNRSFPGTEGAPDIEPLSLWGSHEAENYLSRFSRELGVATCQVVRLRPAAVCLAGVDSSKLRAAVKSILSAK